MGQLLCCLGITKIPFSCRQQGHGRPYSNPTSGAPAPTSGLDLSKLDKVAAGLMAKSLAESTHRAYQSAQNRFIKFCAEANSHMSQHRKKYSVCLLLISMSNILYRTIKSYFSVVRFLHIHSGGTEQRI